MERSLRRHVYMGGFTRMGVNDTLDYGFYVGEKRSFKNGRVIYEYGSRELQFLKRVPEVWAVKLRLFMDAHGYGKFALELGIISYSLEKIDGGIKAVSVDYDPYIGLPRRVTPKRIAYFMEEMAVRCLRERRGITHISTSLGVNAKRGRQLSRAPVNLPVKKAVPIDEWIAALIRGKEAEIERLMARAIRNSLRKG